MSAKAKAERALADRARKAVVTAFYAATRDVTLAEFTASLNRWGYYLIVSAP